jgi:hypothetical protein
VWVFARPAVGQPRHFDRGPAPSGSPPINGHCQTAPACRVGANSDIPMLFTRLASLRDDQDRREVTCAKNLPRYSPAAA